jgi:uncharacterized membrane protein YfcA
MFELPFEPVLLLGIAAFLAGFIDAIAGGAGLITLPALLLSGMPPVAALGTNKMQALFGAGSATLAFATKGDLKVREQLPWAMLAGLGSACGALVA